jgi:putative transposase
MPWNEVSPMEERLRFVSLAESGRFEFVQLCRDFGISRKNGYKWLGRYREFGSVGLKDLSRAPTRIPGRTDLEIETLIVSERRKHPTWGPKKLVVVLERVHGLERPPACSTIGEILKRNGLIKARRRRPGAFKVERKDLTAAERCNEVWATDFKGWFNLENGTRCDPLTISDQYSRFIIRLEAVRQATQRYTQSGFVRAFQAYGLPEIIRVDNGSPFASSGPGGLSKLSVWWLSLGIDVEFTRPGKPQDNGCHERMHRTMKAECCTPASANRAAQQRRFERWRVEFNEERPHEGIDFRFPAEAYQANPRAYEIGVTIDLYEPSAETLPVSESGFISWKGKSWHVGEAFAGRRVALEENPESTATPETRQVRFANIPLGIIGDLACGRLRPTASAARKQDQTCQKTRNNP